MVNARPSDYDDIDPGKLSYGLKYSEQDEHDGSDDSDQSDEHESPNSYYASGIFTKYPDNPQDDYKPDDDARAKRDINSTDSSIDVNKQSTNVEIKRSERKTEDQKISLRSFISSIESDLIGRAQSINANIRLKRSVSAESIEDGASSIENNTNADLNKDLFDGIFEYTRPQRQTDDKDVRIPLSGLVEAVESTFINSAQKIKEPNESKPSKREIEQRNKRDVDEPLENRFPSGNIQVKKLTSSNIHDLNILNPITFKAADSIEPIATDTNNDELISTTEFTTPEQHTNLTVIHSSDTIHLLPGTDQKLAHIQHQQIRTTVFRSNLAIFPTIPPQSINIPLLQTTATEENLDSTTALPTSAPEKLNPTRKQISLEDAKKLKEKIAEIQAEPVILSQF